MLWSAWRDFEVALEYQDPGEVEGLEKARRILDGFIKEFPDTMYAEVVRRTTHEMRKRDPKWGEPKEEEKKEEGTSAKRALVVAE